jgi:30S ribosome assembly GTPase
MIKKCIGCGSLLQSSDIEKEGFTKNTDNILCERCFRITNYGDYKVVAKTNDEFMSILQEVNKTNSLVLFVVDLFNLPKDIEYINKFLKNDQILVINKRDLFAKDIYNQKFLDYVKGDFKDKIIISSEKNYNFDNLLGMIRKYQKDNNIYVVGYTNSGKSTMINKLIYNYSNIGTKITTSILPSTTLDLIKINLNEDITLIDTPGILDKGNISNYVDALELKRILPKSTIRPITYQVRSNQYFLVDDLFVLEVDKNNVTFFLSNNLELKRMVKKPIIENMDAYDFEVIKEDIVINGLGFIKFSSYSKIKIYVKKGVEVYKRESLI